MPPGAGRASSNKVFAPARAAQTAAAIPAAPAPTTGDPAGTPPPKSTPYPPRVVPKAAAIDSTCRTSADCAVKDVGNCCGTLPACVNKDSPTDPAAVQAQCQGRGMVGVCGFRDIAACQCVNSRCEPEAPEGLSIPQEQ